MTTIRFFYIVILFSLLCGCKEQSLEMFSESENGASIYFTEPYATGANTVPLDSLAVKFGFKPEEVNTTEESVSVSVTGPLHDVDREFRLEISPNASLEKDKHYQILNERLIIPAGKNTGLIKLKVLKAKEMKTQQLSTVFELVPNENFNTNIAYRWKNNMQKKTPVLKFRVVADDMFDKPYVWIASKTLVEGYLGDYSFAKLSLIIELFDEKLEHFTDPQYAIDKYFTVAKLSYWASYMKFWLGKEESEGRIHLDENKKEIKMGPNAN
ncbi:DUF4843 domain-containing protein [Sphingobacterium faecale]|uniref:DUF4843 domain-containing protein n=1 Tax=Sphingobacterium faecale TaxID=2803775 RepID=A0ABS1R4Q8_9SPHI|nr:DUF4843 domain-containing protein [Sphingobacterium faecale]MBL1409485.1 DUF4843 domain-containing protein [Sphingobacterium faecale]